MAYLKTGVIRRFKTPMGFKDGVVVRADVRNSVYHVVLIDGTEANIPFGNVAGEAHVGFESKKALLVVAEEYLAYLNLQKKIAEYTQEASAREIHIQNLRNSLCANYRGN